MRFVLILLIVNICSFNLNAQSDPNTRDLGLLTKWFEGAFDNDNQQWYEGRYSWKGEEDEKHGRIHAIHKPITFEPFGDHVFYVEEYMDGDKKNIGRQRVVAFHSTGEDQGGIRMDIYFLKDAKSYSVHGDMSIFNDLTMEDLFTIETCAVYFKKSGDQFLGSMKEKECQFGEGDKLRYSVHDIVLGPEKYWRIDQTYLVKDDSFYKGHPTQIPHKMRRVTYYSCDISFYKTAYYAPSDEDIKFTDVMIHNQGGKMVFDNTMDGKKYAVQLREKEYPFYEVDGSDFFMMRFIEDGQRASKAIVTTGRHPEKVSLSMGWASISCEMH